MDHDSSRRRRKHAPKVRTGCITCKIRRVKCGEEKPSCNRCMSTGRTCDGYITLPTKSTGSPGDECASSSRSPGDEDDGLTIVENPPRPQHQLAIFEASNRERRALDFFYQHSAHQLAGSFSSSFWEGCLLQLSMSEPAIRYAMVTLATLLELENFPSRSKHHQLLESTSSKSLCLDDDFALTYYNKAIKTLIHRPETVPRSLPVVAITCIMFICVELLRGNVESALAHTNSGVKLLQDFRGKCSLPARGESGLQHSLFEAEFVEKEVIPMISWLSIMASVFGPSDNQIYQNPSSDGLDFVIPSKPKTFQEVRSALADITNACVRLISSAAAEKYTGSISVQNVVEHGRLTKLLEQVSSDLESLVCSQKSGWDSKMLAAADELRVTHLTAKIWVHSALSPYEESWDQSSSDFELIVEIAERLLIQQPRTSVPTAKRFSFEVGIVPALHVTAWKCRHPIIRRRACRVLSAWPKWECLFEAEHFQTIFARLIEFEEQDGPWRNIGVDADQSSARHPSISPTARDLSTRDNQNALLNDDPSNSLPTEPHLVCPEKSRVHHFTVQTGTETLAGFHRMATSSSSNNTIPENAATHREYPNLHKPLHPRLDAHAGDHRITFLTKPFGFDAPWRSCHVHVRSPAAGTRDGMIMSSFRTAADYGITAGAMPLGRNGFAHGFGISPG